MTVRDELERARVLLGAPSLHAVRDAALLLGHVLGRDRAWLWAHPEAPLTQAEERRYRELVLRRAQHEPVQYITGEQEFYGLRFRVTPDVLIPRPETELLVEAALAEARTISGRPLRILDVGTGSGAIAVALAHALPRAQVTAVDLSPQALLIARENAEAHGVAARVRFVESDLLSAVSGDSNDPHRQEDPSEQSEKVGRSGRFDIIVSNPPYIADGEQLEAQVRDYEPPSALFAGATGLEVYARLIPQAGRALTPGGLLLLEIGFGQAASVHGLLAGWDAVTTHKDLREIDRVIAARRPVTAKSD